MGIKVEGLDEAEAWSAVTVLRRGEYEVKITDAAEGTSSGGHPQIELQFVAVGPDEGAGEIRDWIHFTPATMGKVKQFNEAVNVSVGDGEDYPTGTLVDRTCRIVVVEEPKRDEPEKMRSVVAAYKAPTAGAGNSNDLPF